MFRVKSPQDFGAAVIFVLIGAAGLYFARELDFGTSARMGPGYFPTMLSAVIVLIGAIVGIRALSIEGPAIERVRLRPLGVVILCIVGFGYLIELLGVAITAAALIIVAGYARPGASLRESVLLAAGMTAFVVVVFVFALGQPLPILGGR